VIPETICQKLGFARNRLNDLEALIARNKFAADPGARHQLTQEFFFHLLGSVDYLAQLINERRKIGLDPTNVTVHEVIKRLEKRDPSDDTIPHLKSLSANVRGDPLPANPYSEEGLIYRAINYRHEVVHRNENPFHFKMSSGSGVAFFWLDPRNHHSGQSTQLANVELSSMYSLVEKKCSNILAVLGL